MFWISPSITTLAFEAPEPYISLYARSIRSLPQELGPLNLHKPISPFHFPFQDYLTFYQFKLEHTRHWAGFVNSGAYRLFVHVLEPVQTKGTAYVVHGYMVHSALMQPLISYLLAQGWRVVAFDLPGHGLSSGERHDIQDFQDYATALQAVLTATQTFNGPRHVISHSTGGATVLEFLHLHATPFQQHVFSAPLVRSAFWEVSQVGLRLLGGLLPRMPRLVGNTAGDPAFYTLIESDPLQHFYTPVHWVRRLTEWQERWRHYPAKQVEGTIIQGTDDAVVEWRYNVPAIRQKLGDLPVHLLPNGKHDLFWELPPNRQQVFEWIHEGLSVGGPKLLY